MQKQIHLLGVIAGIQGIVLFSSKAVMVKLAYLDDVKAIDLLFLRMLFSFPFYVVIAFLDYKKTSRDVTSKDYLWLVLFGILGYYLASFFDFIGLIYIKASLERLILFVYPTIVILLNYFILKQQVTKQQKIAILLAYIGIAFIFGFEITLEGKNVLLGGFFVLLSAITYASYLFGSGWLIPKFGSRYFTSLAMIVSCICVFIHYEFTSDTALANLSKDTYVLGFLIAIVATVIPSYLVSYSISKINSSNFAVIANIGPVSTIILAMIFLGEVLSGVQFIGAALVILGVFFATRKKSVK